MNKFALEPLVATSTSLLCFVLCSVLLSSCVQPPIFTPLDIPHPKRIDDDDSLTHDRNFSEINPPLYVDYSPKTRLIAQRIRFSSEDRISRREVTRLLDAVDFLLDEVFLPKAPPAEIRIKIAQDLGYRPKTEIVDDNLRIITASLPFFAKERIDILVHELFHALYLNDSNSRPSNMHEAWAAYVQLLYANRNVGDNMQIAEATAIEYEIMLSDYGASSDVDLWRKEATFLTTESDYVRYALPLLFFDRVSNLERLLSYNNGVFENIPDVIQTCEEYELTNQAAENSTPGKSSGSGDLWIERRCSVFQSYATTRRRR